MSSAALIMLAQLVYGVLLQEWEAEEFANTNLFQE
jgi:hypothetical protein